MWLICGGNLYKNIEKVCKESTDIVIQGVEDIEDISSTADKFGKEHFKDVKGIIVLDSALPTLVDMTELNKLVKLGKPIHFLNRHSEIVNENLIDSKITTYSVESIFIQDILHIILSKGAN